MKKNYSKYLYWIAGTLFALASIFYFFDNKLWWGLTDIFFAITFISLGFSCNKADK